MNRWNIPDWLESAVKKRDKKCVYCGRILIENKSRNDRATWEHIINDAKIITRENIARCCNACNSSKGTKKLRDWLKSRYCKEHGINKDSVADVVKKALKQGAQPGPSDYSEPGNGPKKYTVRLTGLLKSEGYRSVKGEKDD